MPTLNIPLTLLDPDGGWVNAPVHVSELDGLPVLLHFWSMDCSDCAKQFDTVSQWMEEFGPRGLRVIGVDVTHSARELRDTNAVEAFARKQGLHYPIAVDDGSMARAYDVREHPAFLVFDAESRRLRHVFTGPSALQRVRPVLERYTQYERSAAAPPP
ncbi:TlpA family protein disulfide reductase [Myxococcaceae bacterium JPH2]|nr:TlpA family protein disulfide reductase [Myxococcaceae bacterium JPH2]